MIIKLSLNLNQPININRGINPSTELFLIITSAVGSYTFAAAPHHRVGHQSPAKADGPGPRQISVGSVARSVVALWLNHEADLIGD